eukprot:gene12315-14544_t
MEEEVPPTCPERLVAKKMEVPKKLPQFELEEGPNSKAECLQEEARQRQIAYLYDYNAPEKEEEKETDRLEEEIKKKEEEEKAAKAKKASASASASASAKGQEQALLGGAVSFIMKEVDKRLPEGKDATHRVGNPNSEGSLALEKAFKREGKAKIKNLVAYVRQGEEL